jgi:arabinan endo-1,5-alpha-L-arabinosidase
MRNVVLTILLCSVIGYVNAQSIRIHDPVMAREGDTYYLFGTGVGISVFSSHDMKSWTKERAVFETAPAWAVAAVPGFKGHIWAPDISFHDGVYYLFYSVSAFGKNTSCIGLATNATLNPSDPRYKWIDHGKVIQSVPGRDLWNAIDPNLVRDENGQAWLAFGSFWSGLKLVKLNKDLTQPSQPEEWYTLSKRPRAYNVKDAEPGEGAVEAPFIFRKNGFYYLFASFDFCCRGKDSTYKVVVGRSMSVYGPYIDKNGTRMDDGGGSLVREGNESWAGVGHNAVYSFEGKDWIVYHAYDVADEGKSKLKIEELSWDDAGWPVVTRP